MFRGTGGCAMPGRTGAAWVWVAVATALLATAACGGGGGAPVPTAPGIFTQRYDAQRSGVNSREVILTPDSVRAGTFGKLFACAIDGEAYAEPLVVANLPIGGGFHDVVFVATTHDSVYAFDADQSPCVQIWQKSFLAPGIEPVAPADTGETGDIDKEIGIVGTPVIDPTTRTLYVVAKTKETVGTGCSSGSPCYRQRLHALDLVSGNEKLGGPA